MQTMKNVTITVEDSVFDWARIEAVLAAQQRLAHAG